MSSQAFGSFIDIVEPSKGIEAPAKVLPKPTPPSAIELDNFQWGAKYNGPKTRENSAGVQTPATPDQLESNTPPVGVRLEADLVQSWSNPPMNKWRVLATCLIYLGYGLIDSAPGALIPYIETGYDIGYATVSLIFVTNAVGFIAAAFFTDYLNSFLGRARALMVGEIILMVGFSMILSAPAFGVVIAAFLFVGFGYAIGLALSNVFCSNLANSTVILGCAHGSYGIGGIIGPIIATSMVTHGIVWSRYYTIVLGVRFLCFVFAGAAFWAYEEEAPTQLLTALEQTASRQLAAEANEQPSKLHLLKEALKSRVTIIGALFIFAYQGAEVSTSGWVISFLINYRDGDPAKIGYVTAGFWGGITVGRFVLTHVAHRVGERLSVFLLVISSICVQLLVWLVPNIIGDAVAVALLGLLLGPVYPCAQTIFSRLLPRKLQTVSVGFIGSAGSSGGAVAPFTTGLLAQAVGTFVLHPICIALYVAMIAGWACIPRVGKRRE